MRQTFTITVLCALLLAVACGKPSAPNSPESPQPAKAVIPPEIAQAAASSLGEDAEVLVFGDLAHNVHEQVLAVNRLAKTPAGTVPGTLVTRAVILEKDGDQWKEVFRADEHLKNPEGYLGATPISPVNGWRLQYEQHPEVGLVMYFTPLQAPAGGLVLTLGVRWNPKVKRYQSLDRNFEHFLGEVPALEKMEFQLHR